LSLPTHLPAPRAAKLDSDRRSEKNRFMPDFAHPIERELARLFDEHGIAWEYGPRTFVLERRRGRVLEACAPDSPGRTACASSSRRLGPLRSSSAGGRLCSYSMLSRKLSTRSVSSAAAFSS
jgi:hypothetical protein